MTDNGIGQPRLVQPAKLSKPSLTKEESVNFHLFDITALELLSMRLPPRELILDPWLPEKGLTMVYGPRGIGKTHFVMGCAWAIAAGGEFLKWKAPKPRKVLMIDGEMPAQVLQKRLESISERLGATPPELLRFLPMDMQERGLDLSNETHQKVLEEIIGDADLIVVDNISTLSQAGRENEAESWLPIQQWALSQRRMGRALIFVHHAGKSGQQRGTSRREDVLDTVVALRTSPDYDPEEGAKFEIHFEKNRGFFDEGARPFEVALGAAGWTMKECTRPDLDIVSALTDQGYSIRKIAEKAKMTKSRAHRLQKEVRSVDTPQGLTDMPSRTKKLAVARVPVSK